MFRNVARTKLVLNFQEKRTGVIAFPDTFVTASSKQELPCLPLKAYFQLLACLLSIANALTKTSVQRIAVTALRTLIVSTVSGHMIVTAIPVSRRPTFTAMVSHTSFPSRHIP